MDILQQLFGAFDPDAREKRRKEQAEERAKYPTLCSQADHFDGFIAGDRPGQVIRLSSRGLQERYEEKNEVDLEFIAPDRPPKWPGAMVVETQMGLPEKSLWVPPPGWYLVAPGCGRCPGSERCENWKANWLNGQWEPFAPAPDEPYAAQLLCRLTRIPRQGISPGFMWIRLIWEHKDALMPLIFDGFERHFSIDQKKSDPAGKNDPLVALVFYRPMRLVEK